MNLLVLAGGFGTRLKPVLPDSPKALAPVNNKPFIFYQIENWISQGVNSIVFLLYNQSESIIEYLEKIMKDEFKNCKIKWIVEPRKLDTGGSVAHAVSRLNLKNNFLLTNADTWLSRGIFEIQSCLSPAIVIIKKENTNRYGNVLFDKNFIVREFREKEINNNSSWINAGLYLLNANLFEDWNGLPFSLEKECFIDLIKAKQLNVVPINTEFIDIGIPKDYLRFCEWHASGKVGKL